MYGQGHSSTQLVAKALSSRWENRRPATPTPSASPTPTSKPEPSGSHEGGPEPTARELMLLLYFDNGAWIPGEEEVAAMMNAEVLMYEATEVEDVSDDEEES